MTTHHIRCWKLGGSVAVRASRVGTACDSYTLPPTLSEEAAADISASIDNPQMLQLAGLEAQGL